MAGGAAPGKREGDISDSFASLSRAACGPLPERFRALKQDLVAGREAAVVAGWRRLLARLAVENEAVARAGSAIVPQLDLADLRDAACADEVRRRGVVVVKGVVPAAEARGYKDEIEEYVRRNPSTRGMFAFPFPPFAWSAEAMRGGFEKGNRSTETWVQLPPPFIQRFHSTTRRSTNSTGHQRSSRRGHTRGSSRRSGR